MGIIRWLYKKIFPDPPVFKTLFCAVDFIGPMPCETEQEAIETALGTAFVHFLKYQGQIPLEIRDQVMAGDFTNTKSLEFCNQHLPSELQVFVACLSYKETTKNFFSFPLKMDEFEAFTRIKRDAGLRVDPGIMWFGEVLN